MHQIGIIKTAAATISISALYILYMFFYLHNFRFVPLYYTKSPLSNNICRADRGLVCL